MVVAFADGCLLDERLPAAHLLDDLGPSTSEGLGILIGSGSGRPRPSKGFTLGLNYTQPRAC